MNNITTCYRTTIIIKFKVGFVRVELEHLIDYPYRSTNFCNWKGKIVATKTTTTTTATRIATKQQNIQIK